MRVRLLVPLLVLAAVGMCVFATGKQEAGAPKSKVDVSAPGTFPIVKEKVNLRLFSAVPASCENIDTSEYTKYLEKLTNVHITWEAVPSVGAAEKRTLRLASADLPDVFQAGLTANEVVLYGSQGMFVRLNEIIEEHGVETKKWFASDPAVRLAMTTPNGGIYSVPSGAVCYHCFFPQKYWIYQPWLDKLGLKMPTTTDELVEVLRAFKLKDPNGNGKADEVPLSGAATGGGWYTRFPSFFMNSFLYYDFERFFMMKDGKVDVSPNKEEYRDGLRYLRKLYAEGLLDPAAFVQSRDQLKALGENRNAVLLGSGLGGWFGQIVQLGSESGRYKDYRPVPPLKGPKGVRTTFYQAPSIAPGDFVITNKCPYPVVAFKWADYQLTQEAYLRNTYGLPGVDWDWAKPGQIGINGKQAIWQAFSAYATEVKNRHWGGMGPFNSSLALRQGQVRLPDLYDSKNLEARLTEDTQNYYDVGITAKEHYPVSIYFSEAESAEIAQLKTALTDYIREATDRFITGDMDLDKDWGAYLKELDRIGVARYVDIHQKAYDKLMAVAKK